MALGLIAMAICARVIARRRSLRLVVPAQNENELAWSTGPTASWVERSAAA